MIPRVLESLDSLLTKWAFPKKVNGGEARNDLEVTVSNMDVYIHGVKQVILKTPDAIVRQKRGVKNGRGHHFPSGITEKRDRSFEQLWYPL